MNSENQLITEKVGFNLRDSLTEGSADKHNVLQAEYEDVRIYKRYLNEGETIVGSGYGGSESMTLFLKKAGHRKFVRKVLSERLITPDWSREGSDVMLPPCSKARNQSHWLMNLPNSVKNLFPSVLGVLERTQERENREEAELYYEYIYDMTYMPGIEVSQFVRKYKPSKETVAALYGIIFKLLKTKIHSKRRRRAASPTLEQSYFSKIEKRLALSQRTAPKTFNDDLLCSDRIVINGMSFYNVPYLLKKFRDSFHYQEILEPKFHSLVVGDTNTENIKIGNITPLLESWEDFSVSNPPFTAEDLEISFLDPRAIGFHENGVDTGSDDYMYDNKPWHNSIGNYDKIHGEHFELAYEFRNVPRLIVAFHENSPYETSYRGIEEHFKEVMTAAWNLNHPESEIIKDDPNWLIRFTFLMGTHFMAMPPFHFSKNKDGVLLDDVYNQRRPLAIYAEGIKWLNLALDMLEGKVEHLYGVPVSSCS